MKICFFAGDPFWGGISNNGGSRTILKSAEALRKLGHRVDVVAVADNFKWFKHPKVLKKVPKDTEAIVAISISDIRWMHKLKTDAKKFYWMRGYETWRIRKESKYLKALERQPVIVNSTNLKLHLKRKGISADLCFAGLDEIVDTTEHYLIRQENVGFLGPSMHATKRYDLCEKLMKALPEKHYGTMVKVSERKHAEFYNNFGVWFAPTESEGFHNPPAEAALYGCVVVCNRMETNGMMDYADDETAMRYNTFEEAVECVRNPDWNTVGRMQTRLWEKIGSREENMKRFVKILQGESE